MFICIKMSFLLVLLIACSWVSALTATAEPDQNIIAILKDLQNQVNSQNELISSLQEEVTSQRSRITDLEELVAELQNPKKPSIPQPDLLSVAQGKEVPVDRLNDDNGSRVHDVLVKPGVQKGLNRPSRLVMNAEGPVAFQAHLSGDISHIGLKQKIAFDSVTLNLGNAYHSAHGLFIAPRPGIYLFSASILAHVTKEIEMSFVKNGVSLGGGVLANAVNTNGYDQGSATVVAQLNVGDEVWIENWWPDDTSIHSSHYTCFMGCLVMEL